MVQYFNGLINLDWGQNPENFNERKLLSELPTEFHDFQGIIGSPL